MPKIYSEETAPGSYGKVMEFQLGNGKRLIVHDVDLEDDKQVWYEEVGQEPNCSHCSDTYEYEADTCPYCKPNKEQEDGERAMDFNKGN